MPASALASAISCTQRTNFATATSESISTVTRRPRWLSSSNGLTHGTSPPSNPPSRLAVSCYPTSSGNIASQGAATHQVVANRCRYHSQYPGRRHPPGWHLCRYHSQCQRRHARWNRKLTLTAMKKIVESKRHKGERNMSGDLSALRPAGVSYSIRISEKRSII
jgi:hypothetical protein